MPVPSPDFAAHLRLEQQHLLKADADIDEGRQRVREQERRLARLKADDHDWQQAHRLVELLRQTLNEWEQHRVLIQQRIDYLQRQLTGHDN
jgi:hemerythrin superfamily protein